jgi:hypothetical protein
MNASPAAHSLPFRALFTALAVAILSRADPAGAQSQPQLQVQIDQTTVGVGDVVHLQLSVQNANGMVGDAQPGAIPGFVVAGQSTSNVIMNGLVGLTVDWTLQAKRAGTFHLGPASIVVSGARYTAAPVVVHVVPEGQAPHRQTRAQQPASPFGFSPFDPWKGLFPGLDQLPRPAAPPMPATDPKLSLDAPRGAYYFLHASVDKASAVIGEQTTFSIYAYVDAETTGIEIDGGDTREPNVADFVKHPLLREDQDALPVGYASIGGHTWAVMLVKRWALFPLRAGDLEIGPMKVTLSRPRLSDGGTRTTETLHVRVSEPPRAGRPPGYALGDVGRFALSVQVAPREVQQGGAVGVHVEIAGTGNVPSAIATPAREGVEWLSPEVHDDPAITSHETFGGKRTFDFVVRVQRAGDVDLGQMSLPFWDPEQKRYEVARAPLGSVRATPSKAGASAAAESDQTERMPGLPPPRGALEGRTPPHAHVDDSFFFWTGGIGAWPFAFGLAVVGRAAARRMRAAWSRRRVSPAMELKERVAAATAACESGDARNADAAIARALEAATVAHAAVSVRGTVAGEALERLEHAGVGREAATRFVDLLRECEKARFAPDAADVGGARNRWLRAKGAIRELERRQ